jgi:hypothetical protein
MAPRDVRCLSRRAPLGAKAQAPEPRKGAQKFSFQAEVTRLMDIIIHSLYSNKARGAPAPDPPARRRQAHKPRAAASGRLALPHCEAPRAGNASAAGCLAWGAHAAVLCGDT